MEEPIPTPASVSEILTDKPEVTLVDKATVIEPKPEEGTVIMVMKMFFFYYSSEIRHIRANIKQMKLYLVCL